MLKKLKVPKAESFSRGQALHCLNQNKPPATAYTSGRDYKDMTIWVKYKSSNLQVFWGKNTFQIDLEIQGYNLDCYIVLRFQVLLDVQAKGQ